MTDATKADQRTYKSLTPDEAEHFLTKGWLRIPNAIKQEYLDKWVPDLWTRIGYDKDDTSTWHTEYLHLPRHREVPAEDFAPEAWAKTIDICGGEERIDPVRERYYGDAFICNFGTDDNTGEKTFNPSEQLGWHTDDDWYRMFLDSTGCAITVIHVFTDIPERGGGTCLCEDGIAGVVKWLYDHPEGSDPPVGRGAYEHVKEGCKEFTTVVAKKGDVILLHGLLPHCASPNFLRYARVISNPHVTLKDPYNFNRPDGDYSLLEQVVLRNLGRDSLPEWKPTRERKFWYPRNAGFKRAKAEEELARMVAAAKAKGMDEKSVDSLYQRRGTDEFTEFERRNGFLHEVNPESGLLMVQHNLGGVTTTREPVAAQ